MRKGQMCATCPFSRRKERLRRSPERIAEIVQNNLTGHPHVCHTQGIELDGSIARYCVGAERAAASKSALSNASTLSSGQA